MMLVPGRLWRRGTVSRAVGAGLAADAFFAAFVLVESGSWTGAVVVFVVLSLFYGRRVARRMDSIWPAAKGMNGADRGRGARHPQR
ncbi:hypothetical protein [Streptomyces sp. NPDC046727]|uniref:hypothetical protein n=1 Tax=Streptomyces sp. NPDC046727 TaxID=3155373 RepID=UPI0033FAFC98